MLFRMKVFFCILRTFPLYLIMLFKTKVKKDSYAQRWFKDLERIGSPSFFVALTIRPYYRDLFYHRFHLPVSICLPLFGGQDIAIPRIDIGEGIFLEHPHGTHLNATKIGKGFKCHQNVTLGLNGGGIPSIGDNVMCGVGCCVLGNVSIGNNVSIGANAVVVKSVPDNCVVVGNPAIIVRQDGKKVNIPLCK